MTEEKQELSSFDIETLNKAEELLSGILRSIKSSDASTADVVLSGLIDSLADSYGLGREGLYKNIIQFCSDRLFQISKQRKTTSFLKDELKMYSSRDKWRKDFVINRIGSRHSVGDHSFVTEYPKQAPTFSSDVDAITELFKFYPSGELKKVQTKLASYGNGINRELIRSRLNRVLSQNELNTLKEASSLLIGMKQKIEHAKEKKGRQELKDQRASDSRRVECKAAVESNINIPEVPVNELFNLAIYLATAETGRSAWHVTLSTVYDIARYMKVETTWAEKELAEKVVQELVRIAETAWKYKDGHFTKVSDPKNLIGNLLHHWSESKDGVESENPHIFSKLLDIERQRNVFIRRSTIKPV